MQVATKEMHNLTITEKILPISPLAVMLVKSA